MRTVLWEEIGLPCVAASDGLLANRGGHLRTSERRVAVRRIGILDAASYALSTTVAAWRQRRIIASKICFCRLERRAMMPLIPASSHPMGQPVFERQAVFEGRAVFARRVVEASGAD